MNSSLKNKAKCDNFKKQAYDVYAKAKLTAYMDYLKAKWLKDFEPTFNTKVDQSIKQVHTVKKY